MSDGWDIVLGVREHWGGEHLFALPHSDRRQHLYTVGKSGTGKTTLLHNLIMQDIMAGHGVGVIDPHGDLAADLLDYIPRSRTEDVVYFNPTDLASPVGFNLLGRSVPDERHLVTSGVVSVFKMMWADSWGVRMEYILYATVAALLDCENVSLLGVQRMLSDGRYRAWVVNQVRDPIVRSFWVNEFERYNRSFLQEAVAPIQNKVGQLLMSPHLRNILGQVRSRFDPRFIMDKGRIFIADLPKGKLGADKVNLLGGLLVTQFQIAAMSRVQIPERERRDFFLYVDEFQSFASDSFISILSEARKYRLCLTLAHQYLGQLRREIRDAVLGNVGSVVAFRVGEHDADLLAREFGGVYPARQFVELRNHEVCARLLQQGQQREAFLGRTLPKWGRRFERRSTIVNRSRERFGTKREGVEDRIGRWMKN